MRFVLTAFITLAASLANAAYFECEATATSNNRAHTVSLYHDRMESCTSGNSCVEYQLQKCDIRTVELPYAKIQIEGSCEWNSAPGQITVFEFTNSQAGTLTDLSSRLKSSSVSQLINNNLECVVVR